jgi:hypothetical protein
MLENTAEHSKTGNRLRTREFSQMKKVRGKILNIENLTKF